MEGRDRYTLDDVADRLGVHYQTVYRWVRAGKLPSVKVNGSYVVHGPQLDAFERSRQQPDLPPLPSAARIDRQRAAMTLALFEGDEAKAKSIASGLLSNGLSVTALIEGVIVPPLVEIGVAWHRGESAIYVEHRASGIVERLLGSVAPNPRGRRRGRAMVAAVTGDLHTLPTTMATAALREDNWHVEHLGADVPPRELGRFATSHEIDLAVLSATTPDPAILEEAKTVLEADVGIPTLIGGPGSSLGGLQESARRALRERP